MDEQCRLSPSQVGVGDLAVEPVCEARQIPAGLDTHQVQLLLKLLDETDFDLAGVRNVELARLVQRHR